MQNSMHDVENDESGESLWYYVCSCTQMSFFSCLE